jgi:hypothetical protein
MDLPQLLAGLDVKERHDEEGRGEKQHQQILHRKFSRVPAGTGSSSANHSANRFTEPKSILACCWLE